MDLVLSTRFPPNTTITPQNGRMVIQTRGRYIDTKKLEEKLQQKYGKRADFNIKASQSSNVCCRFC